MTLPASSDRPVPTKSRNVCIWQSPPLILVLGVAVAPAHHKCGHENRSIPPRYRDLSAYYAASYHDLKCLPHRQPSRYPVKLNGVADFCRSGNLDTSMCGVVRSSDVFTVQETTPRKVLHLLVTTPSSPTSSYGTPRLHVDGGVRDPRDS